MVEIVNVHTGSTNVTVEQPFRNILSDLSRALDAPKSVLLLLTDTGESVDLWTRLTKSRYFLLRKDEFKLQRLDLGLIFARAPPESPISLPFSDSFEFSRLPALLTNSTLISTEAELYRSAKTSSSLHTQVCSLLDYFDRKIFTSIADNRFDAVTAILKSVKTYYKALKEQEHALSQQLESLPVPREKYKDLIRRHSSEERTPTLDAVLTFLSEKNFGHVYKRMLEIAKVKRSTAHEKLLRTKDKIKAQERQLAEFKAKVAREYGRLVDRVKVAESELMVAAVENISAYGGLREKLEKGVSQQSRIVALRADLDTSHAAEAQVRRCSQVLDELKTATVNIAAEYCSQLEGIAQTAAKITFELHIKVADRLPKLEKLINSMKKHSSLLTLPEQAQRLCAALDEELSRRKQQNFDIATDFRDLEKRVREEQALRQQFLAKWGQIVPAEVVPAGFTELPDLVSLRREVEEFNDNGDDDEAMQLALMEAKYAQELADLMSKKRHLETLESHVALKLREQEQLTVDLRHSIERMQVVQPVPSSLIEDFQVLKEEQIKFIEGLNRRS